MIEILQQNPLLALFLVTTLGYAIGRFRLFGIQLGVSAILFIGLLIGALAPELQIPALLPQLGLVIYIYTIGLSNGANFFRSLQRGGNKQIAFILFFLVLPALLLAILATVLPLSPAEVAGTYAGVATNTAALASLIDVINGTFGGAGADAAVAAVVLGYSLGYPVGIVGRLVPIAIMERVWQIDYAQEANALRDLYPTGREIENRAIEVTNDAMTKRPLREIRREHGWELLFGRLRRNGSVSLVNGETELDLGDVLAIGAEADEGERVTAVLGKPTDDDILIDQTVYIKRRLFVSNPTVVGQPLAALDLREQYGAIVTRVRRGDSTILADRDTVLELGDRVRVLSRRPDMPALIELFGDSYQDVSRVNLLSFGLGLVIGLLLGVVTIGLSGLFSFQLGFAGGPLVVALVLGALRRTGPIVWTLPYSTNQTLQQVGLILLLAGIGLRSGSSLAESIASGSSLLVVGVALLVVVLPMFFNLIIGYRLFNFPFSLLAGMLASQPAVLAYVADRAKTQIPQIGFSIAFPISVIVKVILAQLLLLILN